jgi:MFS transporter, AAHS family, 4-hydroxybenzoate transporter
MRKRPSPGPPNVTCKRFRGKIRRAGNFFPCFDLVSKGLNLFRTSFSASLLLELRLRQLGQKWADLSKHRLYSDCKKRLGLMSASSSVNITEIIDRCPLGRLQIRIIVLCGLVALLEGYDLAVISVAAPAMAGPLHIAPNQFGAVFSAAVLGLMLGGFGLGPIADRYGRRCVLIGATAALGLFTLCTASAATVQQILLFRFLAGVGLGGAMPSFISLAAEYTPRSNRQAVVGLLSTGLPLGGVMVGLLGSRLIDAAGWQSLFYIGGILPLSLSIVMIRALPDSIEFLVMRGAAWGEIRDLLVRISPTVNTASGCPFVVDGEKTRGVPVWHLFAAGGAFGTILLWTSYFVTFIMMTTSIAWTPTLLQRAGIGSAQSSVAFALFALGNVFGAPLSGFLVSRFAARRVLPVALVGSGMTLSAVGHASQSIALVTVFLAFAGFFLGVASSGLIALTTLLYSTAIRSTGVGWAMGIGRLGSFVGPLAIGILVGRGWQIGDSFVALGTAALCAALSTSLIGINRPRNSQGH